MNEASKKRESLDEMLDRMQKSPESFRYTVVPTPQPPKIEAKKPAASRPKSFFEVFGIIACGWAVFFLLKRLFL